jgi:hypothetical protein
MTTKQLGNLINRLQIFNDWRRGKIDGYDINPKQIGKDIDSSIEILKDCLEVSKGLDCISIVKDKRTNKNLKPLEFITKKDYYD